MNYLSTRGRTPARPFSETVRIGLARDGGLFLPETLPDVRPFLPRWRELGYADLAFALMRLFADDLPPETLRNLVDDACAAFRHPEVAPVNRVGDLFVLELFHGPTLAFKDIALQFLGRLFEHQLAAGNRPMNILAATSGDTGSAAIHGVRGRKNLRIFVLHPRGRISPVQQRQMTSVLDDNVFNLALEGTFDDCQKIVKDLFGNLAFRDRLHLGAVNSINFARLLAQMVYYFYAAFRVMGRTGAERVSFSVPTGNFGDIFAGYLAWKMGLPIDRLVLATNENDILARFFETGVYRTATVLPTLSPSMDIQAASNFERYLFYRAGSDPERLREWMERFERTGTLDLSRGRTSSVDDPVIVAGRADRRETLETIRRYATRRDYLLDPHTAVGVRVAERFREDAVPMICLATAHPAKFPEAIREATGEALARHPLIDALEGAPTRCDTLPAEADAVAEYMNARICATPSAPTAPCP